MDSNFLHERRVGLQHFINAILRSSLFSHHTAVKKFLDPHNYTEEIETTRQQQAAMFVRSEPSWQLQGSLKEVGWRIRKFFFAVKSDRLEKENRYLLAWVEHGQDMCLEPDTSLMACLRVLTTIQHPYIEPVTYASASEKGSTVVRQYSATGSLRDYLAKAKPEQPRLKKYGNTKTKVELSVSDLKTIGRQILEGLKFLHNKGWPYGHLHAGNVLFDGQTCRLLDVENSVLGLSPLRRAYLLTMKGVKCLQDVDVYNFGHLLYEIIFRVPLDSPYIDRPLDNCPPEFRPVLNSILSSSVIDARLPAIDELLGDPCFSSVVIRHNEKPVFKISKLKDSLVRCRNTIETRLKEDQRKIRQFQRLSKARSEIMSEEEKTKRRKSAKRKSLQTAASVDTPKEPSESVGPSVAPPPPPPPAPPLAKVEEVGSVATPPPPAPSEGKAALLSSISSFSKVNLRAAETNDRSQPKI